jgi:NAD(P)-dependent dehydrogenase (short-subunit alcohol dehydrogenase family)
MSSSNKTILLTGASRGIGLAVAHYLLKHGHNLVLVSRTAEPLQKLESQYPEQVAVLARSLSESEVPKTAVDLALSRFSRLDGAIVNHGVLDPVQRIVDTTEKDFREAWDVNFFSAVAIARAAVPELRKTKGALIFVSSGAAVSAYTGWGAYGSAKAAVNHLALTLGKEEQEVVSLAIRPGVVDTDMQRDIREKHSDGMDAGDSKKFAELKSSGGLLKPEQPGHVMAKLVLEAPKELSGHFLTWNADELSAFQE